MERKTVTDVLVSVIIPAYNCEAYLAVSITIVDLIIKQ